MLGFLFGSSKVNEDLEALLKSIEEIEKEIEEEKSSLPEVIPVRDSRSAWLGYKIFISLYLIFPEPTTIGPRLVY